MSGTNSKLVWDYLSRLGLTDLLPAYLLLDQWQQFAFIRLLRTSILDLTLTTERMNMVRHKLKRCSRELTGMNITAQPEEGE
ncbi:hypothetical protein [Brevibacillus sp. FIR094]|uniref:hypothetical protein n=1 Tax=Brevibacillus sp. FIR094 TaxID=3134809 RepID=UPI003D1E2146